MNIGLCGPPFKYILLFHQDYGQLFHNSQSPLVTINHFSHAFCFSYLCNTHPKPYQPLPLYFFTISILKSTGRSVNSRSTFQDLSASIQAPCRNSLSIPGFCVSVCVSLFFIHIPILCTFHLHLLPPHDLKFSKKLKNIPCHTKAGNSYVKQSFFFFQLVLKISTKRKIKMACYPTI